MSFINSVFKQLAQPYCPFSQENPAHDQDNKDSLFSVVDKPAVNLSSKAEELSDTNNSVSLKRRLVFSADELQRFEATKAAPCNHEVLFENPDIRVLKVTIPANSLENLHIHQYPGVMSITQSASIRYYNGEGEVVFEKTRQDKPPAPQLLEPEGLHQVQNTDSREYGAYRIEFKRQ